MSRVSMSKPPGGEFLHLKFLPPQAQCVPSQPQALPIPIPPQTPVRPWNAAMRPLILVRVFSGSIPLDKLRARLQGPLHTRLVRRDLATTMCHHTRFWPRLLAISLFLGSELSSCCNLCTPSLNLPPVPRDSIQTLFYEAISRNRPLIISPLSCLAILYCPLEWQNLGDGTELDSC